MRPGTAKANKKKKQVGFSSTTTKIEAPKAEHDVNDLAGMSVQGKNLPASAMDFYVEKAVEFESFKRIPRFSKPVGAVIHPLDPARKKEPRHRPPRTLAFDGSPTKLDKRVEYHHDRGMPEHLYRPQIDEEKLVQIRAREKLRKQAERDKSGPKKKMSMEAKKTQQAFAKLRSDISIKIKGAEKNLKGLFSTFRGILDKTDAEQVVAGGGETVFDARGHEADGRLVSFMFNAWRQAQRNRTGEEIASTQYECQRHDFVKFLKQFLGQAFSGDKAADLFMHYLQTGSQLKVVLRQISDTLSPKNSMMQDGAANIFDRTNANGDLDMSPVRTQAREQGADPTDPLRFNIRSYGLLESEAQGTTLDFEVLDGAYLEWSRDDSAVGEMANAKLVAPKNKDFQLKLKSWKARHAERKAAKKK